MDKPDNLPADDFFKFDIRTGQILTIESIPKAKKLVKLEVSFGPEIGNRTIVAGLASIAGTNLIEGQMVVAVLNLAPREMMGIMSNGMLLATHDAANVIWLLNGGPVPPGTSVS